MKSPPTTSKEQLRNAEKQFKTTLSHCCLKRQGVSVGEFCHCRGPGTVGLGGWRICGSWWPWVAKKLKNFSIPCRAEMGHDRGWWIASILASEWISDLIIYFILFFIWFNFSIWFIQAEKKHMDPTSKLANIWANHDEWLDKQPEPWPIHPQNWVETSTMTWGIAETPGDTSWWSVGETG
jgi:hypothetical protein